MSELRTVAALFVQTGGAYYEPGLNVDPWDEARDARRYTGPDPVVAHPPCERWGRYWSGGPMLAGTSRAKLKGDDDGCFAFALGAVRKYGGVLEHPEATHAYAAHGLPAPPKDGGWRGVLDGHGGFVCCVEQGHYGHEARKATWLYVARTIPPELTWGPSAARRRRDDGFHSKEERSRAIKTGTVQRLSKRQRAATPVAFRDLLLAIARNSR